MRLFCCLCCKFFFFIIISFVHPFLFILIFWRWKKKLSFISNVEKPLQRRKKLQCSNENDERTTSTYTKHQLYVPSEEKKKNHIRDRINKWKSSIWMFTCMHCVTMAYSISPGRESLSHSLLRSYFSTAKKKQHNWCRWK